MDLCPGRCMHLTTGEYRVSASCPGEAPSTLCAGPGGASVALNAVWQLADPNRFVLERRPKGAGAAVCMTVAGSTAPGSVLQLLPCAQANEAFVSAAIAATQKYALRLNDLAVGGASEARLELTASNATGFASSCLPCPAASLGVGLWIAIVLGLLALALLPLLLARRFARIADDGDWPPRGRLEGWPGVMAQLGWLMVIASLVPMSLALFADAWDARIGVPGWYLTLLPAGAFLMLFMLHPTESAAAVRVVYALAITFFVCTFGLGIVLVWSWLLTARFGGAQYVALACRDALITLLSLGSVLVLWCRGIRAQARAAEIRLAHTTFIQVLRLNAGSMGLAWVAVAAVQMGAYTPYTLSPAMQSDLAVGASMLLTALLAEPRRTFRWQLLLIRRWSRTSAIYAVLQRTDEPQTSSLPGCRSHGPSAELMQLVEITPPANSSSGAEAAWHGVAAPTSAPHADASARPAGFTEVLTPANEMDASGRCQLPEAPASLPGMARFEGLTLKAGLGGGAYGVVWRATQPGGAPDVAVKLFFPCTAEYARAGRGATDSVAEQMQRELRIGAGLFHPHVCATLGYTTVEGSMGIVTELCAGGSLRSVLIDDACRAAKVAPSWLGVWVYEAACGLAFLHSQGVLHRDLKLDNVLLDGAMHAKICDFGISTREQMETSPHRQGTLRYLAPEVIHGAYTPSADVYSFGMLAYSILHRTLPFMADTPTHVALKVYEGLRPPLELPPELVAFGAVIEHCWLSDAHERPLMSAVQRRLGQIVGCQRE